MALQLANILKNRAFPHMGVTLGKRRGAFPAAAERVKTGENGWKRVRTSIPMARRTLRRGWSWPDRMSPDGLRAPLRACPDARRWRRDRANPFALATVA